MCIINVDAHIACVSKTIPVIAVGSRKGSRKGSRRGSRKGSSKGSRKGSRKG